MAPSLEQSPPARLVLPPLTASPAPVPLNPSTQSPRLDRRPVQPRRHDVMDLDDGSTADSVLIQHASPAASFALKMAMIPQDPYAAFLLNANLEQKARLAIIEKRNLELEIENEELRSRKKE